MLYAVLKRRTSNIPIPGDILVRQLATKDRIICPALMLAINRTVKVKGRIKTLTVSIRINKGVSAVGAPAGAK